MIITGLEYALMGAWALQTLSAAVSAMPKPAGPGWYSFWYKFLHQMTNSLDEAFERKFDIAMPRVVDETATEPTEPSESQLPATPATPVTPVTPSQTSH